MVQGETMRSCSDCGDDISFRNPVATICFACFKRRSKEGLPRSTVRARSPKDRDKDMVSAFLSGVICEDVGQRFGVSRQRVHQVLKRLGVSSLDGGIAKARRDRSETKRQAMESACLAKHGCSVDERDRFDALGMAEPFRRQRQNARVRGIEWRFNYGDWCRLWLSSGNWGERGRGADRYCMSRKGDTGAYTVDNVDIKRNADNGREALSVWVGKKKDVVGVFRLYPGSSKPFVARRGRAQIGRFATMGEAETARNEYMERNRLKNGGLGAGLGWTYVKKCKARPYFMQGAGKKGYFATADEARAAYLAACAERAASA